MHLPSWGVKVALVSEWMLVPEWPAEGNDDPQLLTAMKCMVSESAWPEPERGFCWSGETSFGLGFCSVCL